MVPRGYHKGSTGLRFYVTTLREFLSASGRGCVKGSLNPKP